MTSHRFIIPSIYTLSIIFLIGLIKIQDTYSDGL